MRQYATGLNRTWVAVSGLVLLLLGLTSVAAGTGVLTQLVGRGPASTDRVLGPDVGSSFSGTPVVVGVAVVGVLAALLGIGWLLAQVPRTNAAGTYRIADEGTGGLTTCAPSVLTDIVARQTETLPGVTGASAVLRGTATAPELTLQVTADDQTDVPALLRAVHEGPVADLQSALETPLARLGVQVDITPERRAADRVTL